MEKNTRTTYQLADLAGSVSFDKLPAEVRRYAKELVIDSIACMLGGVRTVQGSKIINLYTEMGGVPEAAVGGTKYRLPILNAIYVNSYLATVLDFDDTYDGHPGSTVVPVALSLGEFKGISGKEFLEAVVAGYEIGIRVSNGIKPTPERTHKVRGINTWQIFCATAVAARLLGLNREETAHAFGHAAIHASVPSLRKWGFIDGRIQWLKNNFGWTSYGGALSAILAGKGFVADTTIFDGDDGFWIMASSDRCNYQALREPLKTYYIMKVHIKPYSACRHTHPTLDAARDIVDEYALDPESIAKVEVETFYEVVNDYNFLPTVPFDAVYATPYLVSLVLNGIPAGTEWFKEERLRDPKLLDLARKVSISEWDEASRLYPLVNRELMSRMRVLKQDGAVIEKEVRIPRGDPRRPLSAEELYGKFILIAAPILGEEKAARLYSFVMTRLEEVKNVRVLTELMTP